MARQLQWVPDRGRRGTSPPIAGLYLSGQQDIVSSGVCGALAGGFFAACAISKKCMTQHISLLYNVISWFGSPRVGHPHGFADRRHVLDPTAAEDFELRVEFLVLADAYNPPSLRLNPTVMMHFFLEK